MSNNDIIKIKNKATQYSYYVGTLDNVTEVLKNAKANNKNIYVIFNGYKLFSQFDNEDSCYKKITGKTKKQFDAETRSFYSKGLER